MKHLPTVAGFLLGALFVFASVMVLFNLAPAPPPPPEGSLPALFMGAFAPSGYLHFVKICELVGGVLVMVPRTRNLGLLVLGPILVNILAFHGYIMKGEGLFSPMIVIPCLLAVYLLWADRRAWAGLVKRA